MQKSKDVLQDAHSLAVVFYNTENFFDTQDNPRKDDDAFLPATPKEWTEKRYYHKVTNISKVLKNMRGELPLFVGMAEVENKWVLKDLINTTHLREGNYEVIHFDSKDERGIDVAAIYRTEYMRVLEQKQIEIVFDFDPDDRTRDILYVKAQLKYDDVFHFFVCHWPSRGKGQKETEPKRIFVAQRIRQEIDSILQQDAQSKIVVMGDFNDYPTDSSITEHLRALATIEEGELYNMAAPLEKMGKGSYNHRGSWGMLDQMVISQGLVKKERGYGVKDNEMHLFKADWLLYKNKKLGEIPNKTYSGKRYHGGYSDHLPVYFLLD